MNLTEKQSQQLLAKHGVYVKEICDKCTKILGVVRFTRKEEPGAWCSRKCRDGAEYKPGLCRGCSASLNGKRKQAKYCSDVCRKRQQARDQLRNPETHIHNKLLTDAILASGYGGSKKSNSGLEIGGN